MCDARVKIQIFSYGEQIFFLRFKKVQDRGVSAVKNNTEKPMHITAANDGVAIVFPTSGAFAK
jgi:hypothetical protein